MMDKAEEQTKVGQLQGCANDLADSASKIPRHRPGDLIFREQFQSAAP